MHSMDSYFDSAFETFQKHLEYYFKEYTGGPVDLFQDQSSSETELVGPWFVQLSFGNSNYEGAFVFSGAAQALKATGKDLLQTDDSTFILDFVGEVLNVVGGAFVEDLKELFEAMPITAPISYQSSKTDFFFAFIDGFQRKLIWKIDDYKIDIGFVLQERPKFSKLFSEKHKQRLSSSC